MSDEAIGRTSRRNVLAGNAPSIAFRYVEWRAHRLLVFCNVCLASRGTLYRSGENPASGLASHQNSGICRWQAVPPSHGNAFIHAASRVGKSEQDFNRWLSWQIERWVYRLRVMRAGEQPRFVRSIGKWALTGLTINGVIGSGVFGTPGELNRLLGRASPAAMVLGALAIALIITPTAEVASQFSEPGGAYLYARTSFGRFVGLQVGWLSLLTSAASDAANASLFVVYLAGFFPSAEHGWLRDLLMATLIAVPAMVNYRGAKAGASLSSLLVIAKLLPLGLLVAFGVARFGHNFAGFHIFDMAPPGRSAWLSALLLTAFTYQGFEGALYPAGEVKDPRHTVPFALAASFLTVACVYTLVQLVIVATIGTSTSPRPVADSAVVLFGGWGAVLIAIAVMFSTGGHVSSMMLLAPRLAYSLSAKGEFPSFLSRLHPRYHTPTAAIVCYSVLVWIFAASGGFLWALLLSVGAKMIIYATMCAALIRLRRIQPEANALRVPFGPAFSVAGIAVALALVTRLNASALLLMAATTAMATVNWWFSRGRAASGATLPQASAPNTLVS